MADVGRLLVKPVSNILTVPLAQLYTTHNRCQGDLSGRVGLKCALAAPARSSIWLASSSPKRKRGGGAARAGRAGGGPRVPGAAAAGAGPSGGGLGRVEGAGAGASGAGLVRMPAAACATSCRGGTKARYNQGAYPAKAQPPTLLSQSQFDGKRKPSSRLLA